MNRNQLNLTKAFFELLYKEKLFRKNSLIKEFEVRKYNSQHIFSLLYKNINKENLGAIFRIVVYFKVSGYLDIKITHVCKKDQETKTDSFPVKRVYYPDNNLNSKESKDFIRLTFKKIEKKILVNKNKVKESVSLTFSEESLINKTILSILGRMYSNEKKSNINLIKFQYLTSYIDTKLSFRYVDKKYGVIEKDMYNKYILAKGRIVKNDVPNKIKIINKKFIDYKSPSHQLKNEAKFMLKEIEDYEFI